MSHFSNTQADSTNFLPAALPVVLRLRQVEHATGCKKSFIYMAIKRGDFPRPVCLGPRARGWLASDIAAWVASRATSRS